MCEQAMHAKNSGSTPVEGRQETDPNIFVFFSVKYYSGGHGTSDRLCSKKDVILWKECISDDCKMVKRKWRQDPK